MKNSSLAHAAQPGKASGSFINLLEVFAHHGLALTQRSQPHRDTSSLQPQSGVSWGVQSPAFHHPDLLPTSPTGMQEKALWLPLRMRFPCAMGKPVLNVRSSEIGACAAQLTLQNISKLLRPGGTQPGRHNFIKMTSAHKAGVGGPSGHAAQWLRC